MRIAYQYVDTDDGTVVTLDVVNEQMLDYAKSLGMTSEQLGPKIEHVISFTGLMIVNSRFVSDEDSVGPPLYITNDMFDAHIERYNHLNQFPDEFIEVMREFLVNRYNFTVES